MSPAGSSLQSPDQVFSSQTVFNVSAWESRPFPDYIRMCMTGLTDADYEKKITQTQ